MSVSTMTPRRCTGFRRIVGSQLNYRCVDKFLSTRKLHAIRASVNDTSSAHEGSRKHFLVPGATVATILMLGALHARRLYEDKKVEEAHEKGINLEFKPDIKASFLRALPLRSISRAWGFVTSMEIPTWLRPYVYKAWARAFHKNLEEIALPLEEYASLQEFFAHALKDGLRSIDPDPQCLVSPVDGIILGFGMLKDSEGMIDQVKGFSYSASSLLRGSSCIPISTEDIMDLKTNGQERTHNHGGRKTWWRVSLASPKMRFPEAARETKGLFYCVLYLRPGDYHRVHSPVDWNVLVRRHFSGRLFPVNERATRTVRNLYIENERVVLEGRWKEGFMAVAAIGATNIGSIRVLMEPEMHTNRPRMSLHVSPAEERVYEPEGIGVMVKKGEEVAAFHMGSTVILIFQAPAVRGERALPGFQFSVKDGDVIRVGEALGRWMY